MEHLLRTKKSSALNKTDHFASRDTVSLAFGVYVVLVIKSLLLLGLGNYLAAE